MKLCVCVFFLINSFLFMAVLEGKINLQVLLLHCVIADSIVPINYASLG